MDTTILLVDDHALFRKGLRAMLEEEEGLEIVGEAGDGAEALALVRKLSPDVIIMDISMPGVDGIEGTRSITKEFPGIKILPLSIHSGKRFVQNMLRAGASGYVLKESAPEDLVDAIRTIQQGNIYLSPSIAGVVVSEFVRLLDQPAPVPGADLNDRDQEILRMIADGHSVEEIAENLESNPKATKTSRTQLMKKLGMKSESELAEYAVAHRWSNGEGRVEVSVGGSDSFPLLATKFTPPVLPGKFVSRRRLLDQIKDSQGGALTVVSAPAGFGKSTLLAEWISEKQHPTVWLSLDAEDSDFAVFLTYLVSAVESIFPGGCPNTSSFLSIPEMPKGAVLAKHLINDLDAIGDPFDLVFDDYQAINSSEIHEFISEVFGHPPCNVHWFILTRGNLPDCLARLRGTDRLQEIFQDELSFTLEESNSAISQFLGKSLEESDYLRLYSATEGWITGLQLASVALSHRDDTEPFLAELVSSDKTIQQYLTEQVLVTLTPEFQDQVLSLSLLDRFCGSLCEAVLVSGKGKEIDGEPFIRRLSEEGLFVIPIDGSGVWYRFHHLFRELLERELQRRVGKEELDALHAKASRWLEDNQLIDEALTHFLRGGDPDGAAGMVENHRHAELNADRWLRVERWVSKIPAEIQKTRPRLLLCAACIALARFRIDRFPGLIEQAEGLIDEKNAASEILGELNYFRGQILYWGGDVEASLPLFEEARRQIPPEQGMIAGENELSLALAQQALGNGEAAGRAMGDLLRKSEGNNPMYDSRLLGAIALVELLSGNLSATNESARRLESLGSKHGLLETEVWGIYLQALVRWQWGDFEAARSGFGEVSLNSYTLHTRASADALAGLAFSCEALGKNQEADEAARRLREFAEGFDDPQLDCIIGSCEARLALSRGDRKTANRWLRTFREPTHFPSLIFWLALPALTECRVLIARDTKEDLILALEKLDLLENGFRELHNTAQLVDVVLLQALVLSARGKTDDAGERVREAVQLAEPGGWIRPFVEAGQGILDLITSLGPDLHQADFVDQIRMAFGSSAAEPEVEEDGRSDQQNKQPLIDALTNRELDVLEKVAERLYDKEIAAHLSVSPETVKSHLKHIYQKLDVKNRRQAVARAVALGILKSPD